MASVHGYIESYDYRQMYDIKDWRGSIPKPTLCYNTLAQYLRENEDTQIFYYLLTLTGMLGIFNSNQANVTLLVPSDKELKSKIPDSLIKNMDKYTAREIVQYCTIPTKTPLAFFQNTPAKYVNTRIDSGTLLVENISGQIYLDRMAKIIRGDIILDNGIIHIIDNLLCSSSFAIGKAS